ncbi:hypothetical protein K438DRAFT_1975939 [Mycena galopus ATCC 62051]|nr:hypothetical protein K438DRAFT_1975939 [Mycena galopus ATCC 62051]
MGRSGKPKRIPTLKTFLRAIDAPPSAHDGVGGAYAFCVNNVVKFGRSKHPRVRKQEWERQCRGEKQVWLDFYWEVPYQMKFERIIHLELKRLGAWNGRVECPFCGRNHQEKFSLPKCGGIAGLVRLVEARLNALGWIWRSGLVRDRRIPELQRRQQVRAVDVWKLREQNTALRLARVLAFRWTGMKALKIPGAT